MKQDETVAVAAEPRVKGVKGKKKAASKSTSKGKKEAGKKAVESTEVRKNVDKILKYTPNKSISRRETPHKVSSSVGKASAKKSVTGTKKQ